MSTLHTDSPDFRNLRTLASPFHPANTPVLPAAQPAPESEPTRPDLLDVIAKIWAAPNWIGVAQKQFDKADRAYKTRLTTLSIEALSKPLFPGKEGALRPASNDTERGLAIDSVVCTDVTLIELAELRESTLRVLQQERNTFEAAKFIANVLIAGVTDK